MSFNRKIALHPSYTPSEADLEKIMDEMPYDELCVASMEPDPMMAVRDWAERNDKLPVPAS